MLKSRFIGENAGGELLDRAGRTFLRNSEIIVAIAANAMVTLEEVTVIRAPMERCFDLARSVEVHVKGNRHWGEEAVALGGVTSGLVGLRERVTWRARHFGVRQTLTSEITAMDAPRYFQDEMVRGAFQSMRHDHFFRGLEDGSTEMRDVFCFAAPLGILGRFAEALLLRRYMAALLRERNAVVRQVAESNEWREYLSSDCRPVS